MEDEQVPSKNPLQDACDGKLEALEMLDPVEAYKWLLVANDFGHEDALDHLPDEDHCDEFRHDGGYEIMHIHFDLAQSYLLGKDGLSVNFKLADKHLHEFLNGPHKNLASARSKYLDPLLKQLNGSAKEALENCLIVRPFFAAKRRIERVQRLYELKAPTVITEHEVQRLHEEIELLAKTVLPSSVD